MKRKNAFTLIELLAVIVILAIIALIATPIILGIVEDAKRDTFLRSVELVISTTDIDIANKTFEEEYTYTMTDGVISNLELGIKNTKGMNGTITYDYEGNETYAIHNGSYCVRKYEGLEQPEIKDYEQGMCVIPGQLTEENLGNLTFEDATYTYDATEKKIEVSNLPEGFTVKYTNNKATNAGTYEATATIYGNDIYFGSITKTATLTIEKLFPTFISDSIENDVTPSGNGQLINLGEYGIRYQGYDPDNYIYFNCEDYSNQTSETCETWRIIGVVDDKVKIISEEIGEMTWNDQDGDGNYDSSVDINDWNNSTLKAYLNGENEGDYYASLTEATRNSDIIYPSRWYLRGHNTSKVTKDVMYNLERTTGTVMYETPYIENTKIGIMYPSDWGYAAMETESCLASTTLWYYNQCKPSNWINQGSTDDQWFIALDSVFSSRAACATLGGYVYNSSVYISSGVRPVLYLDPYIELEGEGTQNTPYKLKSK